VSEIQAKTCFIIMPVSTPERSLEFYNGDAEHFLHVLECLFFPAIESSGLTPVGPIVAGSDLIHAKIIKNLSSADLVLCDMSQLNPNVFYEFGIRTALNKPVTLVTDEVSVNIPFDTGIINYHRYNSTLQGWLIKDEVKKLSEHINKTIESEPDRNSLWKYFGIAQTGALGSERATPDDKLSLLIRKVDSLSKAPKLLHIISDHTVDTLPAYREALDEFKRSYFAALTAGGELNMRQMAQLAGMSLTHFHHMMREYRLNDIDPEDTAS
jgi:hypothetical protein